MLNSQIVGSKRRPESDRRLRQADRLGRLLRVLLLIAGRSRRNASEIACELEVSERTVMRDIKALELAGVPVYFDRQIGCYCIRDGFRLVVPQLTEDEILGQVVASRLSAVDGLDAVASAAPVTGKLAAGMSANSRRSLEVAGKLIDVAGLQLVDHSACREVIDACRCGLIEQRQLDGTYSSPYQSAPIRLSLHPIRLCLIKSAWYLIARSDVTQETKTYRIARFNDLRVTDRAAVVPEDFDLGEYLGNAWAVYRGNETFDVRLHFQPDAAKVVAETRWHATEQIERQADGSAIYRYRVDGLEEICNWLLGWTGHVRILEPEPLRDLFVRRLETGLEMNR